MRLGRHAVAAAAVAAVLAVSGCGGSLSRGEVEEIVDNAVADIAGQPAGMSRGEVEQIVDDALDDLGAAQGGLSRGEVEEIVDDAVAGQGNGAPGEGTPGEEDGQQGDAPPRSDAAAYTKYFVDEAISRYESEGLEATLGFYNDPANVDGQWYVFIVDENDEVIGHFDEGRLGLDLNGWVGTDLNGYEFGSQMLTATEEGKWVSYVYRNPEGGDVASDPTGAFELKNAWVVRHDGLLFGSGWYISAEEFTISLVETAVEAFNELGLEGTVALFNDPESVSAGLRETLEYYNSADTIDGQWLSFIAEPDAVIVAHNDPSYIGGSIVDLLGPAVLNASSEGTWISELDNGPDDGGPASMRLWVVDSEGTIFGAGWFTTS